MLPANLEEVFGTTRKMLVNDRLSLTGIHAEKQIREGSSAVLAADLLAERRLVPELCKLWPGMPVLCEEAENSGLASLIPGVRLLPYGDSVSDLFQTTISVDGLDGSGLYANGELSLAAMSAGLIEDGRPKAGIVMMLDEGLLYHTGITSVAGVFRATTPHNVWIEPWRSFKQSLIGMDDNGAVDPLFSRLVVNKLMNSKGARYPLNVPSVAGGIKVLQGKLAAYVTSNARHWDIAGTAALCEAAGMIVRCLDGSLVPWNQVRMPPVVFARDEETFSYVHEQASEYLKTQ